MGENARDVAADFIQHTCQAEQSLNGHRSLILQLAKVLMLSCGGKIINLEAFYQFIIDKSLMRLRYCGILQNCIQALKVPKLHTALQ